MKKCLLLFFMTAILAASLHAQQTVGTLLNDSLSYNGYTLIAPEYTSSYLIDNCGNVINQWDAEQRPGSSTYLLENGNLLRTGSIPGNFNSGGRGGRIELFNWEGDLIWRYDYASVDFHGHHDVAALPNGNILLIAWHRRSIVTATNNGRNPDLISSEGVWSERVIEIEPVGMDDANIVWQWDLWDHLIQDFDSTKTNFGNVADHPELVDLNFEANAGGGTSSGVDWIHFNAINYNSELDQIILSSRHFNELWVIDHSTSTEEAASHAGGNSGKGGDLLYRWGNPESYRRGTFDDKQFFGQHDVQWIESGLVDEGKILVFNNGWNRPEGDFTSIEILDPPVDNAGNYTINENEPFGPESPSWIYTTDPPEDFYSVNVSGVQRLPNGNTLICAGRSGFVFEVNPSDEIVWEYQCPVRSGTGPVSQESDVFNMPIVLFRAYRYGEDYPAFEGRDLTPGPPIELDPIDYGCNVLTNSKEINRLENISLVENPLSDQIKIINETSKEVRIEVFNGNGILLSSFQSSNIVINHPASHFSPGFYVLRISDPANNQFFVQKVLKL